MPDAMFGGGGLGVSGFGGYPGTNPMVEDKRGSDCSGVDSGSNRVLTLANVKQSSKELVFVNGAVLHSADYSASHLTANSTVTFVNPLFDDMYVRVVYFV